jgi:hypothetical protein
MCDEDDGEEKEEQEEEEGEEEKEEDDDENEDGQTDDEDENEDGEEETTIAEDLSMNQLLELIFQLSMTFSTQRFIDGQAASSLLVYFSGVLGFSVDAQRFLPAKNYTPYLSGLIYIQRLLFLEHVLPLRAYPHLGIPRRVRSRQHERLNAVRQRYMVTGSESALDEFLSLRDYGRVIARTDPPSFLLRWSDDGETVFYGDEFSVTMSRFRGLVEYFLSQAEVLCTSLLFGLNSAVDLTQVKDDMTNTQAGFSFIQHPDNGLAYAHLKLSTQACTTARNGLVREGGWDWKAVFAYRKRVEALEEIILGGLYTACGQVPRASELLSLECENGSSTERGIYVWNGSLIYVTWHHKAKRATNHEFVVARFMPVRLGHVVYTYLVYIRRFVHLLEREQPHPPHTPAAAASAERLLFRSGPALGRPWKSSRLKTVLTKATVEVWRRSVNSQLYRQLSIGITEKHVKEVFQPFNRYDDRGATAERNVVFAWQSGHRPIQRATTYGLDGAFPLKLQPALLQAYEWASVRWHEFLHQPSKVVPSSNRIRTPPHQLTVPAPTPAILPLVKRKLPPSHADALPAQDTRSAKRRLLPSPPPEGIDIGLGQYDNGGQKPVQPSTDLPTAAGVFVNLSPYGVIVCRICATGVLYDHSDRHLASKTHSLPAIQRQQIRRELALWPNVLRSEADLDRMTPPRDIPPAFEWLTPYNDGIRCSFVGDAGRRCDYVCRSLCGIQSHCRSQHGWENDWRAGSKAADRRRAGLSTTRPWTDGVYCQRFFTHGRRQEYFEVQAPRTTNETGDVGGGAA